MRAPRQERFAASAEIPFGLMANLVTRRCIVLKSAAEIELIYWLQYHSHQEGGLKKFSENLIARFRDRILSKTMLEIGYSEKKSYALAEVERLYGDVPFEERFGTGNERFSAAKLLAAFNDESSEYPAPLRAKPQFHPAKKFKDECESNAEKKLESYLEELCLNPEIKLDRGPWYFPGLIESLFEYQEELAAKEENNFVETALAKLVHETLDYSLHGNCLTLIDGRARTGKTFAAKKWATSQPGKVRFVEIPPGNSDVGFFRAIGAALGLSLQLNHTLRNRIEYVLRTKNLMLIFDEGQAAWPDSLNREALPFRVSWIMSMVNAGVPISLVVTDQFFHAQKRTERRSGWTSEQFIGRIAFYQPLPEALSDEDLSAVAKSLLPGAEADSIRLLVLNAKASEKYLAALEFTVKRARYLASKAGREKVLFADLKRAISEGVIPSDKALAQVMAKPEKQNSRRGQRPFIALPPAPVLSHRTAESPAQTPRNSDRLSPTQIPQREMQPMETL